MREAEKKAPSTAARRGGEIENDSDAEPDRLIAWLGKHWLQEKLAEAVAEQAANNMPSS